MQLVGTILSFAVILIIAFQKPSENQKTLLIATVCAFISMAAYYFELRSTNVKEALLAVKIGYTGKCFVMVLFLIFVAKYCAVNFSKWLINTLLVISTVMLTMIYTNEYHKLYYVGARLVKGSGYYYLQLDKGPLYYIFMSMMLSIMAVFAFITIRHWINSTGYEKKRVLYLGLSGIFPAIALSIYLTGALRGYDPIQLCLMASCVFVMLTVFRYGLFDTIQIAKENIVVNTEQGMIVVNENYEFLFANPAANIIFPQLQSINRSEVKKVIKRIFDKENSVCEKAGRYYEIRVSTLYEDKVPRGFMAWVFDMTYINQYTRKLIQLKEEAEDANRAKSMFLANVSEEIRNPMNSIVNFTNILTEKDVDREIQMYAIDVKESTDQLLHIVNDIMDISKIESGKMELVPVAYLTKKLIQKTISGVREQMEQKGLQFIVETSKDLPVELYGDNFRIQEVLRNLLSNAIKYTQQGGVTFTISSEQKRHGYVNLIFTVEDTGIGITEENLDRLFNQAVLIDHNKSFSHKGTGLGLAIAKSLMDLMEGKITCESTYGIGTCFTVVVEQKVINGKTIGQENEEREETSEGKEKLFTAPGVKVLVVDDNRLSVHVAEGLLNYYELDVSTVSSGRQAIEKVKEEEFALVLIDEKMPEFDGVETMKAIRKLKGRKYQQLPIILLTTGTIDSKGNHYIESGFNACLSKPIDVVELERLLVTFISYR